MLYLANHKKIKPYSLLAIQFKLFSTVFYCYIRIYVLCFLWTFHWYVHNTIYVTIHTVVFMISFSWVCHVLISRESPPNRRISLGLLASPARLLRLAITAISLLAMSRSMATTVGRRAALTRCWRSPTPRRTYRFVSCYMCVGGCEDTVPHALGKFH